MTICDQIIVENISPQVNRGHFPSSYTVVVILSISAADLVDVKSVGPGLQAVDAPAHVHSAGRVDLEQEDAPVDGRARDGRVGESGRRGRRRRRVEDV